ncbi:MAG: hypothetical protein AAF434_16070 [Pseudomonadota bacterium]
MKCHNCSTTMTLSKTASSDRSKTEWHRCPVCNAEHMSTKLILEEDRSDCDLDPFSQFVWANSHPTVANDENNFQLRQQEYH